MPHYLWLAPPSSTFDHPSLIDYRPNWGLTYPLSEEGAGLLREYAHQTYTVDHHQSGVLADWIEDHQDELLLPFGDNRQTAQDRLQSVIHWLRRRFLIAQQEHP